jgi:pyruvate,water dikinase
MSDNSTTQNCFWLNQLHLNDVNLVGGKCSSLGEMYNNLVPLGIHVPNAFVLTIHAYRQFIDHNNLAEAIKEKLTSIDFNDLISLKRCGLAIRNLILNAEFPQDLRDLVLNNYHTLSNQYIGVDGKAQDNTDVAVRSSSNAEDAKDCSFAGQYDTFLNVRGDIQVIESIKACYASLYNNRAISYRKDINYSSNPKDLAIAVIIQKMVRADCGKSGVMFTVDTESGFKDVN